jgi:hypothetical protein
MSQYGQGGGGWGPPPGGGWNPPPAAGPWGPPPGGMPGGPLPPGWQPSGGGHPPNTPRKRSFATVAGLALAGLVGVCVVFSVFALVFQKHEDSKYGRLTAACDGRAVPGARAYVPGPGAHRVVAFRHGAGASWTTDLRVPNAMEADGVEDADLVLCLGEETHATLESCRFVRTMAGVHVPGSEESYSRTQTMLPVRLVAPATGAVLVDGNVPGPLPRQCNDALVGSPNASEFEGSSVGEEEIGRWLQTVAQLPSGS